MLRISSVATILFVVIQSGSLCFCFVLPITNTAVRSSCYSSLSTKHGTAMMSTTDNSEGNRGDTPMNRREILSKTKTTILAAPLALLTLLSNPNDARADIEGVATPSPADPNPTKSQAPGEKDGVVLFTTQSGLRYINIREGNGRTPRYGELCQISYRAYIKLPGKNSELQQYDSDKAYLIKHGNGRLIPGLDEGLHTLAIGGKRRVIIPPKLGYVGPGVLGPLPESPLGRYKLNRLLDSMVELRGGNVVVDVELKTVIPDEADQGYYEDSTIEPEDFETLRQNLSATAREAKAKGESAVDFFDGIAEK